MSAKRNFIGGILSTFAVFFIISLSVSAQKTCQWEVLPDLQIKFSKEIKKNILNADNSNTIEKIYFVSEKKGFVTGTDFTAATIDGGKTWKIKKIKPALINEIYFADKNKGWQTLVGESTKVEIYQTLDGGKSWKYLKEISESFGIKSDPRIFGYVPTILKVRFIGSNMVWSVGLKKVGDDLEYTIWKSVNGGKTWETSYQSNNSVLGKTIEASFLKLNNDGIVVSSNGLILRSDDNGENWKETVNISSSETSSSSDFFNDFDLADNKHIWAVTGVSGKIYQSSDEGLNWSLRRLGLKDEDFYKFTSVKFANAQTGWIGGVKRDGKETIGTILKTIDGGKTWSAEYLAPTLSVTAMSITSECIFAIGNNGLILRSPTINCNN